MPLQLLEQAPVASQVILLMVGLGRVKPAEGEDLGVDRFSQPGRQPVAGFERQALLLLVVMEDGRLVLGGIRPAGGIVLLPEDR